MKSKYSTKEESKEVVALRKRPLLNGGYSLFLDYSVGGIRKKEYLKMYLVPERNKVDRLQNIETLKTANVMKARRAIEIQNGQAGFNNRAGEHIRLVDYMDKRGEFYRKRGSETYAQTIANTKAYCISFRGENVKLSQVNEGYILGFIDFLNCSRSLGEGTIYTYYTCLMIMLNSAVRERLIYENESKYIPASYKPKMKESSRTYLTLDEVKKLAETRCELDVLKKAFMFSCFCGLRISDIRALVWDQVTETNEGILQVEMKTEKTGAVVYVPLSENARIWLPERRQRGNVFPGLPVSPTIDRKIDRWAESAGITKHITFHCARHTFATLLLTYGTDIYTTSKLLGHSSVLTTQIYAKIVDKKKVDAVNSIPSLD